VLGPREPPYQRLLEDALEGDKRRFGQQDAVDEQWRIVERIIDRAEPAHPYEPGSWGPSEADVLAAFEGGWLVPKDLPTSAPIAPADVGSRPASPVPQRG
jgi:glucose-6-phosphate 1-dehydrogenase